MSRIAKKPISIPEKTEVKVQNGILTVKGPLGELTRKVDADISFEITPTEVVVKKAKEVIANEAMLGTSVSILQNMIAGVNTLYIKKLMLDGIGFKTDVKGEDLVMSLGYSHQVIMTIPKGVKVVPEKGAVVFSGMDKEVVGRFAAEVRSKRKPEPYKGKGFHYDTEVIKRKQGKKSV
jgi:large subunit ribosomal protein L6